MELGIELLDRSTRPLVVTAAGHLIFRILPGCAAAQRGV